MSAATAPRLTGGIAVSLLFHGALVAAFFALGPRAEPPMPPMFQVKLLAAPAGERAIGVVQDQPSAPSAAPAPAPVTPPPKATIVKAKTPVVKAKAPPKAATPVPQTKAAQPAKPSAPAPTAGGGPVGGKGADVANIDTPGLEFPYPGYTQNITRQLIIAFGPMAGRLEASVRFVIRRDGTVDPASIAIVTRSGNYSFDQRAIGAVESVAKAKGFGPLPPGFQEDILPVTFRFSPSIIR